MPADTYDFTATTSKVSELYCSKCGVCALARHWVIEYPSGDRHVVCRKCHKALIVRRAFWLESKTRA